MKVLELKIDDLTKLPSLGDSKEIKLEKVKELAILEKATRLNPIAGDLKVVEYDNTKDIYVEKRKYMSKVHEKIQATSEVFEDLQAKGILYSNLMNKVNKLYGKQVYQEQLKEVLELKEYKGAEPGVEKLTKMRENVREWENGIYILSRSAFDKYAGVLFEFSHFYNCYHYQSFKIIVEESLEDYEALFVVLDAVYSTDNLPQVEYEKDMDTDVYHFTGRIRNSILIDSNYISSLVSIWNEAN